MSDHSRCLEQLFDIANHPSLGWSGLPGAMAVTEELPTILAVEFPPQGMSCPHGQHYYAYPNRELIEALRALNQQGRR